MTRREELEHRAATHCRECLASFKTAELLRYIATMGSPVSRAPREELGEDSDNEGTESKAEGSEPERPMPMAKAAKGQGQGRAKAPLRPAGRDQAGRLQPPLPPSPLQVGREVPADELGPAEVCGQHERLPHEPGQHDRRPQGLHAQAAAGALPADGLASPRAAAAHADGL